MQPIRCPVCNHNPPNYDIDKSYKLAKSETDSLERALDHLEYKSEDLKTNLLNVVDVFKRSKCRRLFDLTDEDTVNEEVLSRYVIRAEMAQTKR